LDFGLWSLAKEGERIEGEKEREDVGREMN